MINFILNKLYNSKNISKDESNYLFSAIINKKLYLSQLVAILISMKIKGENSEEIAGAVTAILSNQIKYFPKPKYIISDIVGTGGDNMNTLNISTGSAFIAAACGLKIVKHINYCISSKSGSADVLSAMGIQLNQSRKISRKLLDNFNLCFLLAPKYNNFFSYCMNIRKQLKTRTILNILGPLVNPAKPQVILIGVYKKNLLIPIINTLKLLKYKNAAVVHCNGMDEISLHSNTYVFELNNNIISNYILTPKDFGLDYISSKDLIGGIPEQNAKCLIKLLKGNCTNISYKNTIAVNVAFLLKLHGKNNLIQNTEMVLNTINNGSGYNYIINLINKGYIKK
ncbi:anthranilate phosphoribosyltransferase [Enterobacteriaceae endosymbiont of Plateumaris pusilla]|uniref:anthranilate phosphoribosyltransferase n=1 Tax=Enterobacteriaceae endosymbiont of Plateumaris pusilla TaxID=2675795 RepID=UPI0031B5683E